MHYAYEIENTDIAFYSIQMQMAFLLVSSFSIKVSPSLLVKSILKNARDTTEVANKHCDEYTSNLHVAFVRQSISVGLLLV